jgi:hypothetical protein
MWVWLISLFLCFGFVSSTTSPTSIPSIEPTVIPSINPSVRPSSLPSTQPSIEPSQIPTIKPSVFPSHLPSCLPSCQPTSTPTTIPSVAPSFSPTFSPSSVPTIEPSNLPSNSPSCEPTFPPSHQPTCEPSSVPSGLPTGQPSAKPTEQPSGRPSSSPSGEPTGQPTGLPSGQPSRQPTAQPTGQPTCQPTGQPTGQPTVEPTGQPTCQPTGQPSGQPSGQPTGQPTCQPTGQPTGQPSTQPTGQPSGHPTGQPTAQPTGQPTGQPTLSPIPYTGLECVGTIEYFLVPSTPIEAVDKNVSELVAYQSPIWIEERCKNALRRYSCNILYERYGVWYNNETSSREERRYCTSLCDSVFDACESFFDLTDEIGLKYPDDWQGTPDVYTVDPRGFVQAHCNFGTTGGTPNATCFLPSDPTFEEVTAVCPDPAVVPNAQTLAHPHEVYVPRFEGSECAISCPNLWYRKGTFYLNTFICYLVAGISCVLGGVAFFQHAYLVHLANKVRKRFRLSEMVSMLCMGVTLSNTASVVFMLVNNISPTDQKFPLQCGGNAGFLLRNEMCSIQGCLVVFIICWQQAWTSKIACRMFCIVRPLDTLSSIFQSTPWRVFQV